MTTNLETGSNSSAIQGNIAALSENLANTRNHSGNIKETVDNECDQDGEGDKNKESEKRNTDSLEASNQHHLHHITEDQLIKGNQSPQIPNTITHTSLIVLQPSGGTSSDRSDVEPTNLRSNIGLYPTTAVLPSFNHYSAGKCQIFSHKRGC